jgi:hypothetical protein
MLRIHYFCVKGPVVAEVFATGNEIHKPKISGDDVFMVEADGREALMLKNYFIGVPFMSTGKTTWRGSFARFIFDNLQEQPA